MARRDNTKSEIPHLDEVFAVAQILADGEDWAFNATVEAFSAASGEGRLGLLRHVLSGVRLPPSPVQMAWQVTPGYTMATSVKSVARPADSVIGRRIALETFRRTLVEQFGDLPRVDRAVLYLSASTGLVSGDLAPLFGVPVSQFESHRLDALGKLGIPPDSENGLVTLKEGLQPFLRAPGRALRDAVRRASVPKGAPSRMSQRGKLLPVIGILLLSVLSALAVTRFFGRPAGPPPRPTAQDVLEVAAGILPDGEIQLATNDPAEAGEWLDRQILWSFEVPDVNGPPLLGAGFSTIANGVRIPTLYYGTSGPELTVGVMNYAILDREADQLALDRETIDRLADGSPPAQEEFAGRSALVLRHRDDLYLAVSSQVDVGLGNRISFPR